WGSLKPHAKAESFRGLLNFSVFRQNCLVTGSPEDLPIQRRTRPRYMFFAEPLFLMPSLQTEIQESGPTSRCHTFFEGTSFPHARPAEPVRPRGSQGNRVRKGTAALFSREPLFLVP